MRQLVNHLRHAQKILTPSDIDGKDKFRNDSFLSMIAYDHEIKIWLLDFFLIVVLVLTSLDIRAKVFPRRFKNDSFRLYSLKLPKIMAMMTFYGLDQNVRLSIGNY